MRPDVEATADSTLKHAFRAPEQISTASGRSYLPDATDEAEALLTEPLFRRPCIASVSDNPWSTAYEHMDGFFNAANALAVMALDAAGGGADGEAAARALWEQLDAFHGEREGALDWAADACVLLFGAMYPCSWAINELMVPPGYASAAATQSRRLHGGHAPAPLAALDLPADALDDRRRRWRAFRRVDEVAVRVARGGRPTARAARRAARLARRAARDGGRDARRARDGRACSVAGPLT